MRTLYNILFTIFFVLSSPYYFRRMRRRGNWRHGFRERFGRYDSNLKQALTNRQVLWLHAVSVGEVNLCTQLIRALELRLPNIKFVVSTTTTTGMAELKRRLPTHISKIYYPIDRRKFIGRALAVINPEAIVLVEAEIWPNFLWRARDLRVPVFLANARLSDRSFRGYKRFGFLFRPLFASFAGVGCQNEADAERLRLLGCPPEAVQVVGNLKFDAAKLDERRTLDVDALFEQLGVPPDAPVLVGGSTHDGEEAVLAEIAQRLRAHFPKLFLVLVPRHFERSNEVGRQLRERGVKFVYRNLVGANTQLAEGEAECLLVNTTGELRLFLRARDGGVRWQKPDGGGRAKSHRAGRARQGDGVRAEHAEFRRHCPRLRHAKRRGSGGRSGGPGARAGRPAGGRGPARRSWSETRGGSSRKISARSTARWR